jgi:ferrochelatase
VKRLAVCAPAFSADCIETLEEIQEEIQEAFLHSGRERGFTYIASSRRPPGHLDALEGVIFEPRRAGSDSRGIGRRRA